MSAAAQWCLWHKQNNHQAQLNFAAFWRLVWRRNNLHQITLFADPHSQVPLFHDDVFV